MALSGSHAFLPNAFSLRHAVPLRRSRRKYRLLVTDELLAFIERTFVDPAPEPDRPRVRAEALAEAAAAELEILPDGTIISRAGPAEFYRINLEPPAGSLDELAFTKTPAQSVTLRKPTPNTVVALQPNKPDAYFTRIGERNSVELNRNAQCVSFHKMAMM